ncbi:GDSL-type esterase/lipase family protein, partial [Actinomyces naeslundii]
MRETRLSFIGDELVAGHGDGRALGWTGRVMARTPRDADILWTSLAVPGETTAQMSDRWGPEVARRSTHTGINRLVVGLGVADVLAGISYARSRLALANILDTAASDHRECFVVGPPPLPEADPDATAQLSQAAEEVCLRR